MSDKTKKSTTGVAKITIAGQTMEVEAPTPFTVVTRMAQEKGLSKVAIYVDGQPLGAQDPAEVLPGQHVDVRQDDGGAC